MLANLRKPVAGLLDQHGITRMHVAIVAVCALGFSFDLLEIALGSVLSAVFSAPQQRLDSGTLAVLLASVYVGAVLGAPSLGWVGDRYGRKLALTLMLLWLAPLSVALASLGAAAGARPDRVDSIGPGGLALGLSVGRRRRGLRWPVLFDTARVAPLVGRRGSSRAGLGGLAQIRALSGAHARRRLPNSSCHGGNPGRGSPASLASPACSVDGRVISAECLRHQWVHALQSSGVPL